MTLTKEQLQKIMNTLPIGYYLKRPIRLGIVETGYSYTDALNTKICISLEQLNKVFKNFEELTQKEIEEYVRSLVYHEVAHAINTPTFRYACNHDIWNIFEDERNETIFRNVFKGVNFKKFCKLINNYKDEKPIDARSYFYYVVRFRCGKRKHLKRVTEIIKDFAHLNVKSNYHDEYKYEKAISEFYKECVLDFNKSHMTIQQSDTSNIDSNTDTDTNVSDNTQTSMLINIDRQNLPFDEQTYEEPELTELTFEFDDILKQSFTSVFDEYEDKDFESILEKLFDNYKAISGANGSAINSHSGVFNPRSVIRDDYKWFIAQNRQGHINQFSSLHLTLFIDSSGSFSSSEDTVNKFLYSLRNLERRLKNFSFDLVTMSNGEKQLYDDDRKLKCYGGNYLDEDIFEIFKQNQLQNTKNFNIVLFDGDAYSDIPGLSWYASEEKKSPYYKTMTAFDTNNTVIISDYSNASSINLCKSCRKILTNDYVNNLKKEIISAVSFLLR